MLVLFMLCFEREHCLSRRRNLIGYKNFSEGALPLVVSCLFTISAVCLVLVLLAGKFKLVVMVAS